MRTGKVFLCMLMVFSMGLLSACGGKKTPVNEPDDSPKDEVVMVDTEYLDVETSPDYHAIADNKKYVTYYFDSQSGNDENDGLAENAPMQSLKALNKLITTITAETPVRILIKAGSEYKGTLKLYGFEASDENPLVVGVYAKSGKNPYAKFVGEEGSNAVIIGASNVRFSGFEITGERANKGIYISPRQAGAMKNVVICDNYFHDINFRTSELKEGLPEIGTVPTPDQCKTLCPDDLFYYQTGAIVGEADTPEFMGASWFENLWIENNKIERVARCGIWIYGQWTYRPGFPYGYNHYYSDEVGYYPHKNVIVRSNYFDHVGGDSVVLGAVHGGWIEKNTSIYAQYLGRAGIYCAGIWVHSCKDVIFQFNEAGYTYLQNGAGDGQGFDIDIGNSNILFQYNYSHHNEGGGVLLCNGSTEDVLYDENGDYVRDEDGLPVIKTVVPDWTDNILRNNVFVDNGGFSVDIQGYVKNITFENNTVVTPGNSDSEIMISSKDFHSTGIVGGGWKFNNNIFVSHGGTGGGFDMSFCDGYSYDSNVFWGFPEDYAQKVQELLGENMKNMITADPGIALDNLQIMGLEAMYQFKSTNEDMLKDALPLAEMNRYDAEGKDVTDIQYFGAFGTTK